MENLINDALVIRDLDWVVERNELGDLVDMFNRMGVDVTYRYYSSNGWPSLSFSAYSDDAKHKLCRYLVDHYYDITEFYPEVEDYI